jgi:hypothetical protein
MLDARKNRLDRGFASAFHLIVKQRLDSMRRIEAMRWVNSMRWVNPLPGVIMGMGLMLGVFLPPTPGRAQQAGADHFESENEATSVREPVLNGKASGSFKKIPYKITRTEVKQLLETPIDAADYSQLNRQHLHDARVLGKVESIHLVQNGKKLILNFGTDHRFCFKVVIDESNYEKFGYMSPKRIGAVYQNKTVLVSGLLTQHQNLPQVVVTLPYQLEVVSGK